MFSNPKEALMIPFSGNSRIFVCSIPTNMRKSFEGLSVLVSQHFSEKLTSGAFFVFLNRSRDRMKILYWDNDGLAIWYKRLEKGRFDREAKFCMNRREFFMLLEGIQPRILQHRYSLF